jgi:hypothetical protein
LNKLFKNQSGIEKSWLVQTATYDMEDIPYITTAEDIPPALVSFSHSRYSKDYTNWIHFYENDRKFICLWNNPTNYTGMLRKFGGIISPDLSIYADYPIPLQYQNKYRNHALAHWYSTQGIPVIPNVRWSNERSFSFCFRGIEKNSIVAVGTHGQMKSTGNRELFLKGLPIMITVLSPHTIIVYGKVIDNIWDEYKTMGIKIIHFPSEIERFHNQGKENI